MQQFSIPKGSPFQKGSNQYRFDLCNWTGKSSDYQQCPQSDNNYSMAAKQRVFISFDYHNDSAVKVMLAGQSSLPDSPFEFKDSSVTDHLTGDWKDKVRRRMDNIDIVIILCGQFTHTATGVAAELEIAREKSKPYFLLAAYSDKNCTKPTSATSQDKLYRWTWENLKTLIHGGR
jgi:hypothetical protein